MSEHEQHPDVLHESLDSLVEQYGARNVVISLKRAIDLRRNPEAVKLEDMLHTTPAEQAPTVEEAFAFQAQMRRVSMSPPLIGEDITINVDYPPRERDDNLGG